MRIEETTSGGNQRRLIAVGWRGALWRVAQNCGRGRPPCGDAVAPPSAECDRQRVSEVAAAGAAAARAPARIHSDVC